MIETLLFILVLAVLVLSHEFGHFYIAKKNNIAVEEFGFGFPPRVWSKRVGETLYSINALPLGGFVRVEGEDGPVISPRSFGAQTVWVRMAVVVAGVVMNMLLAWVLLTVVAALGQPAMVDANHPVGTLEDVRVLITNIAPNSPAATAGIQNFDVITSVTIDGRAETIETSDEFQSLVEASKGKEMSVTLRRSGTPVSVSLTPRVTPPDGEGPIGINLGEVGVTRSSLLESPIVGFTRAFGLAGDILGALWRLATSLFGEKPISDQFTGPVGIAVLIADSTKLGISFLFELVAVLSINLAVINVLPIPALDGGRLFFLGIEAVRRRPIAPNIGRIAHSVSFIILLLLLIGITLRDVMFLFQ
ncbi:MAG: M50 family metallopeptidase [Patescibacteria group bacterium]